MSEKKNTKIGMGEFAVILLVIIIALVIITGIVIIKKNAESEITSGEEKIASLEKQIENIKEQEKQKEEVSKNTSTQNITFKSLQGEYKGNVKDIDNTGFTEVRLTLCENGSYLYNYDPRTAVGYEGYYTYNGESIILHHLMFCANDPSRTIVNDVITLKLNKDGSISDSNIEAVFKKISDTPTRNIDVGLDIKNALGPYYID